MPPEIPDEYKFKFVTTDLTFDQVDMLANHAIAMREERGWEGWAWFRRVLIERLVDPADATRLGKVTWSHFPDLRSQFLATLKTGDDIRKLERQLNEEQQPKPEDPCDGETPTE